MLEAAEAVESNLEHSNVEGTRYRTKESPIRPSNIRNEKSLLDFCPISDRSVRVLGQDFALLGFCYSPRFVGAVKPTLGSKLPWKHFFLSLKKKYSGFLISDDGKKHLYCR